MMVLKFMDSKKDDTYYLKKNLNYLEFLIEHTSKKTIDDIKYD